MIDYTNEQYLLFKQKRREQLAKKAEEDLQAIEQLKQQIKNKK